MATKVIWWAEVPQRANTATAQVLQEEPSPTSLVLMEGWKQKHPNQTNSKFGSDLMIWTKSSPVPPSQEEEKVLNTASEAPPLLAADTQ